MESNKRSLTVAARLKRGLSMQLRQFSEIPSLLKTNAS